MMDEDVLSNEQTEKILQFQELTGIDDINVCRDILIRHHWNLEIAFQERERMNEGVPSLFASAQDSRAPAVLNDRFLQHIFVSNRNFNNGNASGSGGIFGLFSYVVNSLINWCYSTLSSFIQTLLSAFTDRERSERLHKHAMNKLKNIFFYFSCHRSTWRRTEVHTRLQRQVPEPSSVLSGHLRSSFKRR